MWEKVFDDTQKAHYVSNVAGHLGSAKSPIVKARQRESDIKCTPPIILKCS